MLMWSWWRHHGVAVWWHAIRTHMVMLLQLFRARQILVFRWQRPTRRNARLDIASFCSQTQFLDTMTAKSITFVFASLGSQSIFQELFFDLSSAGIPFCQKSINFPLLFQGSLTRSIILSLAAQLVGLPDFLLLVGPFRVIFGLNYRNISSMLRSTCSGLRILARPSSYYFL